MVHGAEENDSKIYCITHKRHRLRVKFFHSGPQAISNSLNIKKYIKVAINAIFTSFRFLTQTVQADNANIMSWNIDAEEEFFYFTTMTIEGSLLGDGTAVTVDVSFPGGFINEEEGVWNSESPSADETAVGQRIVAFYTWHGGIGGRNEANWLHTNHGGLYRTVEGPSGRVVLGRGQGYAVP